LVQVLNVYLLPEGHPLLKIGWLVRVHANTRRGCPRPAFCLGGIKVPCALHVTIVSTTAERVKRYLHFSENISPTRRVQDAFFFAALY
jgi:hypothetical protein